MFDRLPQPSLDASQAARFWSFVAKDTDTACWNWTGYTSTSGYGRFRLNGLGYQAHRVSYHLAIGPVPQEMLLDHLCRNRQCVNPKHLEIVTNRENLLRGEHPSTIAFKENRCTKGHKFSETGFRLDLDSKGKQFRRCLACAKARRRGPRERQTAVKINRRGINQNRSKTHCKNGHEFTPENTYISATRPTWRMCRTCQRSRQRKGPQ